MLIYDRRRCRPLPGMALRRRLTLAQRAKLVWLESCGWRLLFLRGEPASVFLQHDGKGLGRFLGDGGLVLVRSRTQRPGDGGAGAPPDEARAA